MNQQEQNLHLAWMRLQEELDVLRWAGVTKPSEVWPSPNLLPVVPGSPPIAHFQLPAGWACQLERDGYVPHFEDVVGAGQYTGLKGKTVTGKRAEVRAYGQERRLVACTSQQNNRLGLYLQSVSARDRLRGRYLWESPRPFNLPLRLRLACQWQVLQTQHMVRGGASIYLRLRQGGNTYETKATIFGNPSNAIHLGTHWADVYPGSDAHQPNNNGFCRTDLLYGYYFNLHDQVSQTRYHTNLHWSVGWEGIEKASSDINLQGAYTVIDNSGDLFHGNKGSMTIRPDARERLRRTFDYHRAQGSLKYIKMLYICDEPNLKGSNLCDHVPAALTIVREVAAEYPELSEAVQGVIYFDERPHCHLQQYDVVGFDNYKRAERILNPGDRYDNLRQQTRPGQPTMLVPGAYRNTPPDRFMQFAEQNPEVAMVIPFIWANVPSSDVQGQGIVTNPAMREAYSRAGRKAVYPNTFIDTQHYDMRITPQAVAAHLSISPSGLHLEEIGVELISEQYNQTPAKIGGHFQFDLREYP